MFCQSFLNWGKLNLFWRSSFFFGVAAYQIRLTFLYFVCVGCKLSNLLSPQNFKNFEFFSIPVHQTHELFDRSRTKLRETFSGWFSLCCFFEPGLMGHYQSGFNLQIETKLILNKGSLIWKIFKLVRLPGVWNLQQW